MILKISLRAKADVPKTLVKRKFRLHFLYSPQNTLMLTEFRGEFSDLHSIFRLRGWFIARNVMCSMSARPQLNLNKFRFKNHKSSMKTNKKTCEVAIHFRRTPHMLSDSTFQCIGQIQTNKSKNTKNLSYLSRKKHTGVRIYFPFHLLG